MKQEEQQRTIGRPSSRTRKGMPDARWCSSHNRVCVMPTHEEEPPRKERKQQ